MNLAHAVLALAIALALTIPTSAQAQDDCPSSCVEVAEAQGVLFPTKSCLTLQGQPADCACTGALVVDNKCNADLVAENFRFAQCISSSETLENCRTVPASGQGVITLPTDPDEGVGDYEKQLSFRVSNELIALQVNYTLGSRDSSCATTPPTRHAPAGALLTLAGLVALRTRRGRA